MSSYDHLDGIKNWQGWPAFFYRQAMPETKQRLRKEDVQHFYKHSFSDFTFPSEYPQGFYSPK